MSSPGNRSIAYGLLIGVGVGIALDNIGLGMALGVVFGAAIHRSQLNKEQKEQSPGEE